MDRSPRLPPRGPLATRRLTWLWLVVAGVLGLWLLALLVLSPEDEGTSLPRKLPRGAIPEPEKPQYGTAEVFTKRPEIRAVRPSPPLPPRVDPAKSE